MQAIGGQLRVIGENRVIGFDMTAAFALAEGLGVPRVAVATFLPAIEQVVVRRFNESVNSNG